MYAFVYAAAFVLALWAPFVYAHVRAYGEHLEPAAVATHAALCLFNAINVMICLWENALYLHQGAIKAEYAKLKRRHGKALPPDGGLFRHVALRDAITLRFWATAIWSTYSLLDPSYSDCTSYGFWIDTGNGVSMPIPTLLLSVGMTWDVVPPRVLGAIALVANWQMLYGTVLYFSSYVHNRRYVGCSTFSVTVVVIANGIWIAFPALAMRVGWSLVESGTVNIVRA